MPRNNSSVMRTSNIFTLLLNYFCREKFSGHTHTNTLPIYYIFFVEFYYLFNNCDTLRFVLSITSQFFSNNNFSMKNCGSFALHSNVFGNSDEWMKFEKKTIEPHTIMIKKVIEEKKKLNHRKMQIKR